MKRMSIGIKYIMIFTIVIFLWVTVSTRMSLKEFKAENYPRAASGTIDFSKWNFDRQEPTNIDGEWQVYNGQFLSLKEILEKPEKDLKYGTVPMNWNSYDEDSAGFATYMLSIEGLEDEVTYGISIQRVFTSYRLWINGKPVAQVGEISADREHWLGKVKPQLVFVQPKNGKVEMIFHVSGFDYYKGGILDSMQIGSQMQMTEQFNERMMLDSFLAGIILIMAIYHVMRYLFRKKDKENLYFGIFAFLVFLETIFEGQMIYSRVFSAIEFRFEENLQSIVLFLMLPSLASYVYYFFEKKINKKIINCIWAVGLAFSIAIIMSPMSAVGVIWRIFEIIIILVLVYLLYFLVDIAKSNDNQAAVMLAGFSVFTITAVHDVLVELEIFPTPYILPFGLVLLLLSQILMISMKYAGSFEQIESLTEDLVDSNKKLKKSNVEMEKRIQERTRALAESENRYRQLFDAPFEGIVVIDEKGVTIEVNKELCNMTGYDKSEVIGKNALEFIDPAYHEIAMEKIFSKKNGNYEATAIKKNGNRIDVQVLSKHFVFNGMNVRVGAIRDLTERKMAEKAAKENLRFLRALMDTIPNPIFYKGTDGIYTGCNDAYAQILGMPKEKVIGSSVYDVAPKHLADIYHEADKKLFENPGKQVYEAKLQDGNGEQRDVMFTKATFDDEDGNVAGMVGVVVDISSYKQVQEQLMEVSVTDHLTRLYNRVKFNAELDNEISKSRESGEALSIIMFDIDRFKDVNDTYGHFVGDEVLVEISDIARGTVCDDNVIARWGGEEFMILCINKDSKEAMALAEKLRFTIEEHEFNAVGHVTCSFGVTEFKLSDSEDYFVNRVDKALYEAKNTGRNRVVLL